MAQPYNKKMTGDKVAQFRALYFAGQSWADMAGQIDVDARTLQSCARREGFGPRGGNDGRWVKWSAEAEARLVAMAKTETYGAMAKALGVSYEAVKNKLERMGLSRSQFVPVKVDTYTGSPAWFRAQFGGDPLPPMHPIACEVLGLRA